MKLIGNVVNELMNGDRTRLLSPVRSMFDILVSISFSATDSTRIVKFAPWQT